MIEGKELRMSDAALVAQLHQKAFENFFLSRLGLNFLTQFYKALISREDTLCFGYWNKEGILLGFFIANYNHRGFYRDLCLKNSIPFILSSLSVFLLHPFLLFRLIKAFTTPKQTTEVLVHPYLMSICVSPDSQNSGLGKKMVNDLLTILKKKKFGGLWLTTDAEENEATNSFYQKNRFDLLNTMQQGKRKMNVYLKILN